MTVLVILPFFWLVLASFKTYFDLLGRPNSLPSPWTLDSYLQIFGVGNFDSAFFNSVIVSASRVAFACVTSVILGYIFAKYQFKGRNFLFGVLLTTMLIPFPVILIPLYLRIVDFQLVDNIAALLIVHLFTTLGIFLLRQWIMGIPDSFIDAARMDGASELWIVWRVILPLSAAPVAALAVFTLLGSWDDFIFPSIVLSDPDQLTLPLALAALKSQYWERYDIFAASAMVTIVPVMILYGFLQRHFVRGLTMGGTKD
jgi:ABC-type glycerol-3-phosphate transport system permease component